MGTLWRRYLGPPKIFSLVETKKLAGINFRLPGLPQVVFPPARHATLLICARLRSVTRVAELFPPSFHDSSEPTVGVGVNSARSLRPHPPLRLYSAAAKQITQRRKHELALAASCREQRGEQGRGGARRLKQNHSLRVSERTRSNPNPPPLSPRPISPFSLPPLFFYFYFDPALVLARRARLPRSPPQPPSLPRPKRRAPRRPTRTARPTPASPPPPPPSRPPLATPRRCFCRCLRHRHGTHPLPRGRQREA